MSKGKRPLDNIDLSSLEDLANNYPKASTGISSSEKGTKSRKKRAADANLTVKIPDYVLKEMKIKSAQEGKTQRQIILEGLVALGMTVEEEDMVDRRKN